MVRIRDEQNLEAQLRRFQCLTRDELAAEWVKAHGVPAPRKSSRELLLKTVAHHLQVQVHGDLRPATRKALLRMARQIGPDRRSTSRRLRRRSSRARGLSAPGAVRRTR